MTTEELQLLAINALNDVKAIDLVVYDVREMTSVTDVIIICTGRSNRQVKSLAENVVVQAKAQKVGCIRMEGEREGEWIIVDLADVVVHVMLPAARDYYHLEDLWDPVQKMRKRSKPE